MAMKHVNLVIIRKRVDDMNAVALIDGMSSRQKSEGVICHNAIDAAGYIGTY